MTMISDEVSTQGLHTNCALEVEVHINKYGHYYFRIKDISNGSFTWLNSNVLSEEEEMMLEDKRNEINLSVSNIDLKGVV